MTVPAEGPDWIEDAAVFMAHLRSLTEGALAALDRSDLDGALASIDRRAVLITEAGEALTRFAAGFRGSAEAGPTDTGPGTSTAARCAAVEGAAAELQELDTTLIERLQVHREQLGRELDRFEHSAAAASAYGGLGGASVIDFRG